MRSKQANIALSIALAAGTQVFAAEVENPTNPQDWSAEDRIAFTERWNRANLLNLLRGPSGAQEYRTIGQRTDFYNWFDQIRKVQKHEIMWPSAAWLVASQMRNLEDPTRSAALAARRAAIDRTVDSELLLSFAREGNRAIFDDVFPRLKEVFERGVIRQPLQGDEARIWDKETLRREQFEVVQPVYERYARGNRNMAAELMDLAAGSDILSVSGIAIGNALVFTGDILSPQDRYDHGLNVVVPTYKKFESTIDGSRQRRQQAAPDPTGGGMVQPRSSAGAAVKEGNDRERGEAEERREADERSRKEVEERKRAEAEERTTKEAEDRRRADEDETRRKAAFFLTFEQQQREAEQRRAAEAQRSAQEAARQEAARVLLQRQLQEAEQRAAAERARQEAERARQAAALQMEEAARRAAMLKRAGAGGAPPPAPPPPPPIRRLP